MKTIRTIISIFTSVMASVIGFAFWDRSLSRLEKAWILSSTMMIQIMVPLSTKIQKQ